MLESLELRCFQSHEHTIIPLSRVTVLVGPSDTGKSACLRALRWLATNRPGGTDFIRWGSKRARARLTLDGGQVITRFRSDRENTYTLDGVVFTAMGAAVPEPVGALLAVTPDNFQGQLDGPYWFSESGGEVSRYLNAIINLGSIDTTAAALGAMHRNAEAAVQVAKQRQAEASDTAIALDWVADAVADWHTVRGLKKTADTQALRAAAMRGVVDGLRQARQAAAKAARKATAAQELAKAAQVAGKAAARVDRLRYLLEQHKKNAPKALPDFVPVEKAKGRWELKKMDVDGLRALVGSLRTALAVQAADDNAATAAKAALEKATEGKCPICGRQMKK